MPDAWERCLTNDRESGRSWASLRIEAEAKQAVSALAEAFVEASFPRDEVLGALLDPTPGEGRYIVIDPPFGITPLIASRAALVRMQLRDSEVTDAG